MLKIYKVTFNDGGWHSGPLPNYMTVAESEDEAIKKIKEEHTHYNKWDVWATEFKMKGYVIELYDEKTYHRKTILENLID